MERGLAGEVVGGLSAKYGPSQLLFEVRMCGTCVLFEFMWQFSGIIHLLQFLPRNIYCYPATCLP